jgi:hypothetical protein
MLFLKLKIPIMVRIHKPNFLNCIKFTICDLLPTVEIDWQSLREEDEGDNDQIVGGTAAAAGEIPYQVTIPYLYNL